MNVTPSGNYSFNYQVDGVTYATSKNESDNPNVVSFNTTVCSGEAPFKVIVTDVNTGCAVLKDTMLEVDGDLFVTYNNPKNPFTVIGENCEFSVPDFINPSAAEISKYGEDNLKQYLTATSGCGLNVSYTQTPAPGTKFTDSEIVTITASNECGKDNSISFVLNTNMPTSQPELAFVDGACPNDDRQVKITGWNTSTDRLEVYRRKMTETGSMASVTPTETISGDVLTFKLDYEYDYLVRMTHIPTGCNTEYEYKGRIRPGDDVVVISNAQIECDPSSAIKATGITKKNLSDQLVIAYDNVSWQYTTDRNDVGKYQLYKWNTPAVSSFSLADKVKVDANTVYSVRLHIEHAGCSWDSPFSPASRRRNRPRRPAHRPASKT